VDPLPPPVPWLPPDQAGPDGLVGVGGDLSPATLLAAYRDGVFPWFNDGDPILWWSPDPRAVIPMDGLHVSRSLARRLRRGDFTITANRDFPGVIHGCATGRAEGTWITAEMVAAYVRLHRLGHAHSVEVWRGEELVGGVYGVAVGGLFAGESMFHRATDASKVALVGLVERLRAGGFTLFDIQMRTDHTARMGAVEVSRAEYLPQLRAAVATTGARFGEPVDTRL
jgi:leucyl/phenylalanyl-tRNA--protein transferase